MGILGKILIFLNLLAAGALAYFALQVQKINQEYAYAAVRAELQVTGLPLESPVTQVPTDPEEMVAFPVDQAKGVALEELPVRVLNRAIPSGGKEYGTGGGAGVANQTQEVVRLQEVVLKKINEAGDEKLNRLRQYLLNLARTGLERDSVVALFDLLNPRRARFAKADLYGLGYTPSQQAALKAYYAVANIGDVSQKEAQLKIPAAKTALKTFAEGEAKAYPAEKRPADVGPVLEVENSNVSTAAEIDAVKTKLATYATGRAFTKTEAEALNALIDIYNTPTTTPSQIEKLALALLNDKFEVAKLPFSESKGTSSKAEKARTIAHLLYFIDADRHLVSPETDAAIVADRKEWHARVAAIVGLAEYTKAADRQADEFQAGADRLRNIIAQEEAAFREEYETLIGQAQALAARYFDLQAQLKRSESILQETTDILEKRKTERDELKTRLAKTEMAAKEALAKANEKANELFRLQMELRNQRMRLSELERELRKRELGE